MACCAVAALIFSQIYLALMTARRWLFGAPTADGELRSRGAAAWRAGIDATAKKTTQRRWFDFSVRRAVAALLLSLGSVGIAYAVVQSQPTAAAGLLSSLFDSLCSSR